MVPKINPIVLLKAILLLCSFFRINVCIAQCTNGDLATPYDSNNSNKGVMFNLVTGASPVTIISFDLNCIGTSTGNFELYYKSGTYVGSETNAAAWTLAGTVSITSLGTNSETPVPLFFYLTIPANSTYGFYFTNNDNGSVAGVRYTNGTFTTIASDANLSIDGGLGKAYPFGADYAGRRVNCSVHYYIGDLTQAATISTVNATAMVTNQNSSGTNTYAESCTKLITKVTGAGASPVNGSVTGKVWIESTQPTGIPYVKRHYEITPAAGATTATGRVTLYFTQQEFNDFNAVSSVDLPTGTSDATGKANLLIEKRPGTSSDGTGKPNTYTGTPENINPADADIVWNATSSRWEVSFDVSGFSGFFVKTNSAILPIDLITFSAGRSGSYNLLQWQINNQANASYFELESSANGANFNSIALINAKDDLYNYSYKDASSYTGTVYYRLKTVDKDGTFAYSKVALLNSNASQTACSINPNPASGVATITVNNNLINTRAKLLTVSGGLVQSIQLNTNKVPLNTQTLNRGIYVLQFADGTVLRFIRE